MKICNVAVRGLSTVLLSFMLLPVLVFADEGSPVKIEFDENSNPIDIISGEKVPGYEFAERGSIRFYLWDIHQPQEYFTYLHDGVRTVPIDNMISMEKVQDQFAEWDQFSVWIISFKSGGRNSPRVRELAVSFIPLENSGERVYLKMSDMKQIIWE
ncbi:MAG: hypothetical protein RLN82_05225 [Pseudomonadales bacterium]